MTESAYLARLLMRLGQGVEQLSEDRRRLHGDWLLRKQQRDGGFPGREPGSDLYYSAFALRALAVLGELTGPPAERAAAYLRAQLEQDVSVIDLISLVLAARQVEMAAGCGVLPADLATWSARLVEQLESLRTDDGGYAKSSEGHAGSTYQTFLIALVYEALEIPHPDADRARDFLLTQRREDGGFVEIRAMRRSGLNPTAAAVAALEILGQTDLPREPIIDFVAELQNDEGGFCANTRIPIADLLSTFTALQTLVSWNALDDVDGVAARRFAQAVEEPTGGFRAAGWDDDADVEYSFYGLGVLALTTL